MQGALELTQHTINGGPIYELSMFSLVYPALTVPLIGKKNAIMEIRMSYTCLLMCSTEVL